MPSYLIIIEKLYRFSSKKKKKYIITCPTSGDQYIPNSSAINSRTIHHRWHNPRHLSLYSILEQNSTDSCPSRKKTRTDPRNKSPRNGFVLARQRGGRISIRWPIFLVREFLLRELEEICGQGKFILWPGWIDSMYGRGSFRKIENLDLY